MSLPGGPASPSFITSVDGTRIAVWQAGDGVPLVLVHGTTADHTTWRAVAPPLASHHLVLAMDRRGRGDSGDSAPYDIAREEEDVANVASWAAELAGRPVAVVGHSYGGRLALEAALRTEAIGRLIIYEGPVTRRTFGEVEPTAAKLDRLLAAGERDRVLEEFLRQVVGMTDEEWAAFRSAETYPRRVAAAHTIPRELRAGVGEAADLERFAAVRQPVLQLVGGASDGRFRVAAEALSDRLAHGRLVIIDGARHAAHHSHAERFAALVTAFTGGSAGRATIGPT